MLLDTEYLDALKDSTLVNQVGALYDLGEDNAPIVADHIEEMKDTQQQVQTLLDTTIALYAAYNETQAQLKAQKDANVKLMYDATQQAVQNTKQEEDKRNKENDEIDDALANIDLSESEY